MPKVKRRKKLARTVFFNSEPIGELVEFKVIKGGGVRLADDAIEVKATVRRMP